MSQWQFYNYLIFNVFVLAANITKPVKANHSQQPSKCLRHICGTEFITSLRLPSRQESPCHTFTGMRLYLTPDRYYSISIKTDLFGERVLVCRDGGRRSNIHKVRPLPCSCENIRAIIKRRVTHGYKFAGMVD